MPPDDVTVFAVNGATDWIDRADYWFSLDHSRANYSRICKRRAGVEYYVAWPSSCPVPSGVHRLRRVERRGQEPRPRNTPQWWCWRWRAVCGLSEMIGSIHSGNSAYGALGLAYHLGYTDAALVGVDATQEPRIDGTGRPNNLSHLPLLFASAIDQINVVSCGQLTGIPKMTFEERYQCES